MFFFFFIRCEADDDDHQAIIDCLRLEDAETIDFWSFVGFLIYHQQLAPFLPIVDGDFIAEVGPCYGLENKRHVSP